MELDNLKELWSHLDRQSDQLKDDEQIQLMLQKKSRSPIAKMKRNLFVELITVLVLYSAIIWYFLATSLGGYREIALLLFTVGLLFLFYYYQKNKLLDKMQCVTCEVRSNLQQQLNTLSKYVRFYFLGGIVLTPLTYFVTGFIVLVKYPGRNIPSAFMQSGGFIIFISIGIVVTVANYFINKWYIRRLYGQHIARLKELLLQMEETEQSL